MVRPKICVFFSDTGGGHRSAAEAIRTAVGELSAGEPAWQQPAVFLDNVVEKSHSVSRQFVRFYNYLLKNHQNWMQHYYSFVQTTRPNELKPYYLLVRNYIYTLLEKYQASSIVSVHPMLNHYLAWAVEDMGLIGKTRLITVVTDPNEYLWNGWSCKHMDLIIAPNDLARNKLVELGTPPQCIKVMGMPVNPIFLKPPVVPRSQFLSLLGLDPSVTTICINAGWAGGGNMLKIYEALTAIKQKIQVVFLCGNNHPLFDAAEKLARIHPVPTAVLPAHDYMSDLMKSCDLMVTKAGGLTTYECIASHLPMALDLITPAMPQERGTADLLVQQGLAAPIRRPHDIVFAIENRLDLLKHRARHLPTAHSLDNVNAVYDIAQTVLNSCNPDYDLIRQPARNLSQAPLPMVV